MNRKQLTSVHGSSGKQVRAISVFLRSFVRHVGQARRRAFASELRFTFLGLLLCTQANIQCVSIDGGAAELSWAIRSFDGTNHRCADTDDTDPLSPTVISRVRLCWLGEDDSGSECLEGQQRDFLCTDNTATTLFEIAEGPTRFFVEPLCKSEEPANPTSYQRPPDIVRDVREGEIVTLGALLLVVSDKDCTENCTCAP